MKDKRNHKLLLNITYHPNFSNLKDTLSFLHPLLRWDLEHQKVFFKVPIIGFQRVKSLKDIVGAKVPLVKKNEGLCGSCKKLRCEICEPTVNTGSFKSAMAQHTYFIRLESLKYSSENVVYLFTCKTWSKQEIIDSTEDFRPRFSDYTYAHCNLLKGKESKQDSFNIQIAEVNHNGGIIGK